MKLPAPSTTRDYFELFANYKPESGLPGLFADVELEGVEPRRIYFALHGRAPERRQLAVPGPEFSPLHLYTRGFASNEFRNNVIPRFLEAYPEKRRLLFIHIPKAAGSELSARLMQEYPHLISQVFQPGWGKEEDVCLAIRNAVLRLRSAEAIFVGGHNTLERYRTWRAIRYQDELFAAIRDPVLAAISQVNYVITRIFVHQKPPRPDSIGWRTRFEVTDTTPPDKQAALDLARRIMRDQGVVPANVACKFLGGTSAEEAWEKVVCYDVELVAASQLDRWFQERWGIYRQSRSNLSVQYIGVEDLSPADREHLASISAEDAKLHERLSACLARTGKASAKGVQLA